MIFYCIFTQAGCQWIKEHASFSSPTIDVDDQKQKAQRLLHPPDAMVDQPWIRTIKPKKTSRYQSSDFEEFRYRWRHPALKNILVDVVEKEQDPAEYFHQFLDSKNFVVCSNAAIVLGRLDDQRSLQQLETVISQATFPVSSKVKQPQMFRKNLRLAAAEALGSITASSSVPVIRSLIQEIVKQSTEKDPAYEDELQAELLRSLSRHVAASEDRTFSEALQSSSREVQQVALNSWAKGGRSQLPDVVFNLATSQHAEIRRAAVQAIAASQHPKAMLWISAALEDNEPEVQIAAINALAKMETPDSLRLIKQLLKRKVITVRAATVTALIRVGNLNLAQTMVEDDSWRVRVSLAQSLTDRDQQQAVSVALTLLEDRDQRVRMALISTLTDWQLRWAGPVLIAAIENDHIKVRQTAHRQLVKRWQPAKKLPLLPTNVVDSKINTRLKKEQALFLKKIHLTWEEQYGKTSYQPLSVTKAKKSNRQIASPSTKTISKVAQLLKELKFKRPSQQRRQEIQEQLISFESKLLPAIEKIDRQQPIDLPEEMFYDVLPKTDPLFVALRDLTATNPATKRKASSQLKTLSEGQNISIIGLKRIQSLIATEDDPVVWQNILSLIANDKRDIAAELATVAISHPASDVRRRACVYFYHNGTAKHQNIILPSLEDESTTVVKSAVQTLRKMGNVEKPQMLIKLLNSNDPGLRIEAAATLTKIGNSRGRDAMLRLSYHQDFNIRRDLAVIAGELEQQNMIPLLIRLLNDHTQVRRAALKSLTKLADQDIGKGDDTMTISIAEQIRRWKRWHQQQ